MVIGAVLRVDRRHGRTVRFRTRLVKWGEERKEK
jgi:hypothetical protein